MRYRPTLFRDTLAALVVSVSAAVASSASVSCPFAIGGQNPANLLSDGLLFARVALTQTDLALVANTGATQSATQIQANIAINRAALDLNASGYFDIEDATLIARYLAGFRGNALTAFARDARRRNGSDIERYIADGCVARIPTACDLASGRVLNVGLGRTYATPREAAAIAQNGDVVKIAAGEYRDEVATWRVNNLTICGEGGRAKLFAPATIPNGKAIWVIPGNDVTIDGIEFNDAKVPDQNGAGIRIEGINLTILNSGFFNNENGMLGGSSGVVTIRNSEFVRNSFGDGFSHNVYINDVDHLIVQSSFFYGARVGHNLKSRAEKNTIENSYFMDGNAGNASYIIDFSNGGDVYMRGNLLHKGPNAVNRSTMIAYGLEGMPYATNKFEMVHNTAVITTTLPVGSFASIPSATQSVKLTANLFASVNNSNVLGGTFSVANAVLQSNFATTAANVPGADNINAPNFWPSGAIQAQLVLPSAIDATYANDAPRPFQLRPLAAPARTIGALQSAP